jgi:hypothetical protein
MKVNFVHESSNLTIARSNILTPFDAEYMISHKSVLLLEVLSANGNAFKMVLCLEVMV